MMPRRLGGMSRMLMFARESGYLNANEEGQPHEEGDRPEPQEPLVHEGDAGEIDVEEWEQMQIEGYEVVGPPHSHISTKEEGEVRSTDPFHEKEPSKHFAGASPPSEAASEERKKHGAIHDSNEDGHSNDGSESHQGAMEELSDHEDLSCVNCAQPTYACEDQICSSEYHHCWEEKDLEDQLDAYAEGKSEEEIWNYEGTLLTSRLTMNPRVFVDPPKGTLLACDRRMILHKPSKGDSHPERPRRLSAMYHHLVAAGVAQRCVQVQGTECSEEQVLRVHTPSHREAVENCAHGLSPCAGSDTYACLDSSLAARLATGTVLDACRRVLRGEVANGAAVVRPPGHHAEPNQIMGFCFYNYVAVAAKMAITEFGLERVLILDWDVHHGNGTQSMFWDDGHVLYVSLHRYDGGNFYPGTGGMNEVGIGEGEGYNVNIPWPHGGMGDAEYLAAFHGVIMPIAHQFAPQLVLVSAGFDAARGDPLGGCKVSPACYAQMTSLLRNLAGGKIVVALEGGYNLRSISNSMEGVVRVLLGEAPPERTDWHGAVPAPAAMWTLRQVAQIHATYWSILRMMYPPQRFTLQPGGLAPPGIPGLGGDDEVGEGGLRGGAREVSNSWKRRFPKLGEWLSRYGGKSGVWSWHVARKRNRVRNLEIKKGISQRRNWASSRMNGVIHL